jgi:8-oxo-dGTP pyrophosphatase MutT (NUDIX family)
MSAAQSELNLDVLTARAARFVPRRAPALGRPAAVLAPILPRTDGLHLLFTERSAALRAHAGQISFPGGKVDPGDAGVRETALREANEEVGLDPSHAQIIGELDDCPTFVTGYVISPVVAIIDPRQFGADGRYPWRPSAGEVMKLHELPMDEFLAPGALRIEDRERDGVRFELYWYTVRGTTVWGATARIVHQLLDVALARPVGPPPWAEGKPGTA